MIYLSTTDLFYGKTGLWSNDEIDYADELWKEWKRTSREPRLAELLNIFPEAQDYVILFRDELEAKLNNLYKYRNRLYGFISNPNNVSYDNQWFWRLVADAIFLSEIPMLEDEFNKYNRAIDYRTQPINTNGKITDRDIELAKEIPLDTLLDFSRAGFAHCIFHDEKSASMKWYRNRNAYVCFGCNAKGDSIDIVIKLYNLKFLDAVKMLIKK